MRILVILACVGGCAVDNETTHWHATASCTIRDTAGRRCHEYDLWRPEERNTLRDICSGRDSAFDPDNGCADTNRIGHCQLDQAPLTATYVYAGYVQLDAFIASCSEAGGAWEPE